MKNHDHEEMIHMSNSKYTESYVHLADSRSCFVSEIFTKKLASELTAFLMYYDNLDNTEDITIYIHSPGGDASGLAQIYDVIQMIKSPVKTVCLGKAYSAGAVLLAAGTKGKRFIMKNAHVMIHGIQCAFPISGTDLTNSKNYYSFLKENNDGIMKILADHTGHTLEKVKQDCTQDVWLDAKQALAYGLVDHII